MVKIDTGVVLEKSHFRKIQEELINRMDYIFLMDCYLGCTLIWELLQQYFPKVATYALFTVLHGLASIKRWGSSPLPLNLGRPQ